jgi:uncharacterized protein YyaL (SSP411 family)
MVAKVTSNPISKSIVKLFNWVVNNQYLGWDIYDGLNSPLLRDIKSHYLRVFVLQANKYCPINMRPFLKIEKGLDLKGMTLFAQAYASLYTATDDKRYLTEMQNAVEFIKEKSLKKNCGYDCWASHYYPYTSINGSTLSLELPDIIGTSQAIIALIESYKITKNAVEKEIASSAIDYLVNELFIDDAEIPFFKYTGSNEDPKLITLNASAQALEAVSAFQKLEYRSNLKSICEKASQTLLHTQRDDGSWVYSIHRNGSTKRVQLDFHQGYIIDGLLAYLPYSNDQDSIRNCIARASDYYQNILFRRDGRGYYRHPLPYPIDIHNQAQGIITFSKLSSLDRDYLDFANEIALWTVKNMQDRSGYFYYQKWPVMTNKIPHMRWGQAWMMLALATFWKNINGELL